MEKESLLCRMGTSMIQRVGGISNATQWVHANFGDDAMGLKVEDQLMDWQNAKKLLESTSPDVRADVQRNAEQLRNDFNDPTKNHSSNNSNGSDGGNVCN